VSGKADIIYSGPINHTFNAAPGAQSAASFQLDHPGHYISGVHTRTTLGGNGNALFGLRIGFVGTAGVAGFTSYLFSVLQLASKLSFGQTINTRPFVTGYGHLALYPNAERVGDTAQWLEPGTGFVGFRFNVGSGVQYGWARIDAEGQPGNVFTLIDYAFTDQGERITAGQTGITSVPDSGGSLGLLALGCAGLLAWRARRSGVAG
jgi:hypothetical protein